MKYSRSDHYSLALHDDAKSDLDALWQINEDAAADILAFLDEAKLNQRTLENFSINGYVQYGVAPYNVKEWVEARRDRYILWRTRLLWLKGSAHNYRIIYAFHPREYRYYVLGVVDKELFSYDINNPISKRITAAYDALRIPRY